MYENHFQEEKLVEFDIDGAKFEYKPATAGEENDWLNEYLVTDDKGQQFQDHTQLNKCKIRNLKKVPYTQDVIKKISGFDKSWDIMDKDEKWILLSHLKPSVFSKVIININQIDAGTDKEKSEKKG